MAYVKPENRDTTWYIWNELYRCRIPYIHSRSLNHVKIFGTPTTGIEEIDKEMTNELITTFITIDKMVEYFKKGVTIRVVDFKDTAKIYERISNHLVAWKHYLDVGVHLKDAPLEDLVVMDEFANAVYVHAKHQFTRDYVDSVFARQLTDMAIITKDDILTSMKPKEKEEEMVRPSMSEFFTRKVNVIKQPHKKWG